MRKLIVSINSVAVIRESRKDKEPDPVTAALMAEFAGADGIAIHLRMDKRHIRDRDLYILRETVKTKLDLHIAPTPEMVALALEVKPAEVTLLPERSGELATEFGLDLREHSDNLRKISEQLRIAGCRVFAVVEPEPDAVKYASKARLDGIQLLAYHFTEAKSFQEEETELERLIKIAETAKKNFLPVRIGGGLSYTNITPILSKTEIEEFVVGHHIVARAVITGFEKAVKDMADIVKFF